MIDQNKIPEHTRKELEELLGSEEAQKYLDRVQYNFHKVQVKILRERLEQKFGWGIWTLVLLIIAALFLIHHYLESI
jgi:hypothetical protein